MRSQLEWERRSVLIWKRAPGHVARWTLKRVQGDGGFLTGGGVIVVPVLTGTTIEQTQASTSLTGT
jgi:hypothetical protein